MAKINVGDKAPDFFLYSQTGEKVTLLEFFGKKNVVVYFCPSDESSGCTRESQEKCTQPQAPKVRANHLNISNECSENQMRSFISLM